MSKDMKDEISSGWHCLDKYEQDKRYHLDPNNREYGAVLCLTKKVKSGITFNLNIIKTIQWKPRIYLKYMPFNIQWLCFFLYTDFIYDEITGDIIADHLKTIS